MAQGINAMHKHRRFHRMLNKDQIEYWYKALDETEVKKWEITKQNGLLHWLKNTDVSNISYEDDLVYDCYFYMAAAIGIYTPEKISGFVEKYCIFANDIDKDKIVEKNKLLLTENKTAKDAAEAVVDKFVADKTTTRNMNKDRISEYVLNLGIISVRDNRDFEADASKLVGFYGSRIEPLFPEVSPEWKEHILEEVFKPDNGYQAYLIEKGGTYTPSFEIMEKVVRILP